MFRRICPFAAALTVAVALTSIAAQAQTVFINEIHYDNNGPDVDESVEIVGPAGTNVDGWRIVRYNGSIPASAVLYSSPAAAETLQGAIPDSTGTGYGFIVITYPPDGLQNGGNDGVALVNAEGAVLQFLCYEGVATASNGPAAGQTCADIGVSESATATIGDSLQLTGAGVSYGDFTWTAAHTSTFGCVNAFQTLGLTAGNPAGGCGSSLPVFSLIHDIQGAGPASPLAGRNVVIEGIVAGDFQGLSGLSGFFVQEEDADTDADPETSEGVFVFDGSNPRVDVAVGDKIEVTGIVSEFNSSGITLTELTNPLVRVVSPGNALPTITHIEFPSTCLSCLERYEGMLVQIDQPMTVTDNFNHGAFGELTLSAHGRRFQPTHLVDPGAPAQAQQNANDLERIVLDDGSGLSRANLGLGPYPQRGLSANNTARLGDVVKGPIAGVLDHRFGAYRIHPSGISSITFNPPDNPRPPLPRKVGGRVRVASFNVLNYFTTIDDGIPRCGPAGNLDCRGANSAAEFTRQRDKIVSAIHMMNAHIVGLTEMENGAAPALQDLVAGLNAMAGMPRWDFINTGAIGTDAIKVAFIYQPDVVQPIGTLAILTSAVDPRVIDRLNRPALAQTFQRVGAHPELQRFTVVVNHFKSKGTDCDGVAFRGTLDRDIGDGQGNCNLTRTSIASALVDWLATNPTHDPTAAIDRKILIMGDLNSYANEDPINAITSTTFTKPPVVDTGNPNATYINLIRLFMGSTSYSYVFEGQSGYLDHAFANPTLEGLVTGVTEWHINADEPVAVDYNVEWTSAIDKNPEQLASLYDSNPYRSSDHDPLVVGFNPLCGDLNDDGVVDVRDLLLLNNEMGYAVSPAKRRFDFNRDGVVTQADLLLFDRCSAEFREGGLFQF